MSRIGLRGATPSCTFGSPYSLGTIVLAGHIRSNIVASMFPVSLTALFGNRFFDLNRFIFFGRAKRELRRVAQYRFNLFYVIPSTDDNYYFTFV